MSDIFEWPVDISGTSREVKFAVRTVQFGDGYEQRQAKGLRKKTESWQVSKVGYKAEIDAIEAFLNARAGVKSFIWRRDGAADLRVTVDGYNTTPQGADVWKISFTFKEVLA
ncbi:hypothetical protein PL75_03180 [Neisseria arctica]|uniref:Phage tail protein n=1 Tax=Neisseria arctica TaxID=1470200 RepID=A0A0J0YT21_9NEIS|nr:phage tail protein [Neisseria arctica]KLT73246.1 hypothetical protein PL75_03180 [Neisseria arctica]UOO87503.1 phage tail protein [Neisseria arctica]